LEKLISEKIISNTKYNIFGSLWIILVGLFLMPYIIGHIGKERFGLLAIVAILTGYFGLLDFGIGTSFVKHIAEFNTRKEHEKINQVVTAGFVFYTLFSIVILMLALLCIDGLVHLFRIPDELHDEASFVFLLGVVLFGLSAVSSSFGAIQGGLQRMDLSNKIAVAMTVPNVLGIIFFLEQGYGIKGIMINNGIIALINGIINVIVAHVLLPDLKIFPVRLTKAVFFQLVRFGSKLQFARMADLIVFQTNRLIIAYFFSLTLVTYFQIGSLIVQKAREIPLLLVSAILPAASEIEARREEDKLRELYVRGSKYLILVSFPIMFFVIVSADIILIIWMGTGYESSTWIIRLLGLGYLFNVIAGVGVSVGAAVNKPEFQMKAAMVSTVSSLALGIGFAIFIGFPGVVVATVISLTLGPVYFFKKWHSYLNLDSRGFFRNLIRVPLIASVIPSLLVCGIHYGMTFFTLPSTRLINLGILILEGGLFTGIYVALILQQRYLDPYDLILLRKHAFPPDSWISKG